MISEKDIFIKVEVFTTKYLGKEDLAVKLLNLLLRNNTPYVPEKWGADGRPRYGIDLNDLSPVIEEWLGPKAFKNLLFARKRPAPVEMWLDIDRFERAKFNSFDAFISDKYFKKVGQENELNAFAGPRFPDEPCEVPKFDFSDLRPQIEALVETPDQKLSRIAAELEAKVYKLINRSRDQLTFQGKDKSIVVVDLKTGSISLDITGTA